MNSEPKKQNKPVVDVNFWLEKLNGIDDYPVRCRCASLLWFSHLSKVGCKNTELHKLILEDRDPTISIDVAIRTLYEIGYDYCGKKVMGESHEKRSARKQNASAKTRKQTS